MNWTTTTCLRVSRVLGLASCRQAEAYPHRHHCLKLSMLTPDDKAPLFPLWADAMVSFFNEALVRCVSDSKIVVWIISSCMRPGEFPSPYLACPKDDPTNPKGMIDFSGEIPQDTEMRNHRGLGVGLLVVLIILCIGCFSKYWTPPNNPSYSSFIKYIIHQPFLGWRNVAHPLGSMRTELDVFWLRTWSAMTFHRWLGVPWKLSLWFLCTTRCSAAREPAQGNLEGTKGALREGTLRETQGNQGNLGATWVSDPVWCAVTTIVASLITKQLITRKSLRDCGKAHGFLSGPVLDRWFKSQVSRILSEYSLTDWVGLSTDWV